MGNYDRRHLLFHSSIYVHCIKKNVRLEKRTGTATNTYTRELHRKRHDLMWLNFLGHFQDYVISSLQMPEL